MELDDFMTPSEFAIEIKRPYNTIMRWLRKGWVRGAILQKLGNDEVWFVPKERVKDYPEWNPTNQWGKRGKAKKSQTTKASKRRNSKKSEK
jgi:hypothetical protein